MDNERVRGGRRDGPQGCGGWMEWRFIDYEKDWNNSTENTCRLCCTVHMFTWSGVVLLGYVMRVFTVFLNIPRKFFLLQNLFDLSSTPFLDSSPRVFMLFVFICTTGSHLLCSITSFSLSCSSPTTFDASLSPLPGWNIHAHPYCECRSSRIRSQTSQCLQRLQACEVTERGRDGGRKRESKQRAREAM